MRLCFVIATLRPGGAQRVLSLLANAFAERGASVTVLTFDPPEVTPFFPLSPGVTLRRLPIESRSANLLQSVAGTVRRWRIIRRALRDCAPDVVLSFVDITNIRVLASALGTGLRVVVAERTDPARHRLPLPWRVLRGLLYPLAHTVVVQTEDLLRRLPWAYRRKARRIPNPVQPPRPVPAGTHGDHRVLLSSGRLIPSKGFDVLLRAFALAASRFPDWTLRILGDGPERARLEALADELGLAGKVRFEGMVKDVSAALHEAEIFVFASRYEGFPNALVEALAHGCPVISTDCPCGPAEIVREGVDGLLVPVDDIAALAGAMQRLMEDRELRRTMAMRAGEATQRFRLERVLELWQETF